MNLKKAFIFFSITTVCCAFFLGFIYFKKNILEIAPAKISPDDLTSREMDGKKTGIKNFKAGVTTTPEQMAEMAIEMLEILEKDEEEGNASTSEQKADRAVEMLEILENKDTGTSTTSENAERAIKMLEILNNN